MFVGRDERLELTEGVSESGDRRVGQSEEQIWRVGREGQGVVRDRPEEPCQGAMTVRRRVPQWRLVITQVVPDQAKDT